jgi:hypothetical protein
MWPPRYPPETTKNNLQNSINKVAVNVVFRAVMLHRHVHAHQQFRKPYYLHLWSKNEIQYMLQNLGYCLQCYMDRTANQKITIKASPQSESQTLQSAARSQHSIYMSTDDHSYKQIQKYLK